LARGEGDGVCGGEVEGGEEEGEREEEHFFGGGLGGLVRMDLRFGVGDLDKKGD
jgi:hypothetical protein